VAEAEEDEFDCDRKKASAEEDQEPEMMSRRTVLA
jgi:hypothetical protein